MRKERFEAISDAVLAIIATLMVLEIKVGDLTDASLKQFVFQLLVYAAVLPISLFYGSITTICFVMLKK